MKSARLQFIIAMSIVGSIGIFVRLVPFPSSQIALVRGCIGALSILTYALLTKKDLSPARIKADILILLLSGAALGINWILLFQAYRYTTIANAIICYYTAPVIVVALSPFLLKEKLNQTTIGCIFASLIGIVFITGLGNISANHLAGLLYGLGGACFFAAVVILNKHIRHVNGIERSIVQLTVSALAIIPYITLTTTIDTTFLTLPNITVLLIVGVIHTGLVYLMFFSALEYLPGQTIAILSYIEPVVAILLSALLLKEPFNIEQFIGSILIIGSAIVSERKSNPRLIDNL